MAGPSLRSTRPRWHDAIGHAGSCTVNGGNIYLTAPEYPASGFTGTGQWVISESSIVSGSPQVLRAKPRRRPYAIMRNVQAATA